MHIYTDDVGVRSTVWRWCVPQCVRRCGWVWEVFLRAQTSPLVPYLPSILQPVHTHTRTHTRTHTCTPTRTPPRPHAHPLITTTITPPHPPRHHTSQHTLPYTRPHASPPPTDSSTETGFINSARLMIVCENAIRLPKDSPPEAPGALSKSTSASSVSRSRFFTVSSMQPWEHDVLHGHTADVRMGWHALVQSRGCRFVHTYVCS